MSVARRLPLCLAFLAGICFGISSCAPVNLTNYTFPENPPLNLIDKSIAVLPFKGSVPPLSPAGEWFAFNLTKVEKLDILTPAEVELSLHDNDQSMLLPWKSEQDAVDIGRVLGTELVALGNMSSVKTKIQWNAVCDVTLIDAVSGKTVGQYQGIDTILDYYDTTVYYMRAANKAAYEIIGAKKVSPE